MIRSYSKYPAFGNANNLLKLVRWDFSEQDMKEYNLSFI